MPDKLATMTKQWKQIHAEQDGGENGRKLK